MYHCQAIGILHDRCLKPPTNSQAKLAQRRAPIHHATARPPYWVICWRIVVRMSILVLFQILKDKLSAFTIESDFSCGLIISSLYHFEVSSFYTHSVESYHKGMLNYIKCFSSSIEIRFLSLVLLMWWVTVIVLWTSTHPRIPGMNSFITMYNAF